MLKLILTILILPMHIYGKDSFQLDNDHFVEELELMVTPGNITKKLIPGNQPIKLNCINKGWNLVGANITWFYKACGSGTNRGLCESAAIRSSEDVPLCGVTNLQPCSPRLSLDRPMSGLYKCYKMEKKAGYVITATLVNTFQLEIMDRSMKAPEFDEVPEDQTTFIGNTVVFKCKVRSTLPLHVNWYKQVEKLNAYGTIQYEKKFYQSLNVTEVSIKGDIQSELKLKRVTFKDSGTYACGAINEAGIRYKEATLIVHEAKDEDGRISKKSHYDEWKWALIASAIVLIVLLVKCLFCWKLLKSAFSIDSTSNSGYIQSRRNQTAQSRAVNRKKLEFQPETGNETSDYEQVFTL
ncbi:hypothetical protein O3M35_012462 [Rhynocoris fuscipes]|uniref:receptor protein-tyrosine kinase n=1 Tax=Rhynocoris fuscipes TaxID=488301 RepID=A0AAW1CVY0_9HEMI